MRKLIKFSISLKGCYTIHITKRKQGDGKERKTKKEIYLNKKIK